jgi:hypothetical protein
MARKKSKAIILAADGTGGMQQVPDRRFERGDWPISLEFNDQTQADTWLTYLQAESGKRGWSYSTFAQMDAKENSGSSSIGMGSGSEIAIIWERKRARSLRVRARSAGSMDVPIEAIYEFLRHVSDNCRAQRKEVFYRRGLLEYEGPPWKGELWLNPSLRLGPPSRQDDSALIGPRIIVLDAVFNAIDWQDAAGRFPVICREVAVFLSVVLRMRLRVTPQPRREWTFTDGSTESELRWIGYIEQVPTEMPPAGVAPPIPLYAVNRPDFTLRGIIVGTTTERDAPADILELWKLFEGLSGAKRSQFLQVGSMWQLSLSLFRDYQTSSFAWMVAACEALKPPGRAFKRHNIYDVTEALLGKRLTDLFRQDPLQAQHIRSVHLHTGELQGWEFAPLGIGSSFEDPSLRNTYDRTHHIVAAAIVEWLRQKGQVTLPPKRDGRRWRRILKTYGLIVLALLIGLFFGWVFWGP